LGQRHPATPQSIAGGALVYRQNCVACHGLDAHGNGPLAPTLNPRPADLILHVPLHPDADLYGWISDGFPGSAMPAFRAQLTDQQRWDVLNYLKSLSSTPAASVSAPSAPTAPPGSPTLASLLADVGSAATLNAPLALASQSVPAGRTSPTPVAPSTPAPRDDTGSPKTVGDLRIALKVRARVFQPADFEVDLTGANGQPASSIQRVDLQTAMVGMNHGARGIRAKWSGTLCRERDALCDAGSLVGGRSSRP
jgi:hypothetical protein